MSVPVGSFADPLSLRPLSEADLDEVTRLNNEASPAVPLQTRQEMAQLVELCDVAVVTEDTGGVVGFLLGVEPGKPYQSENYRFFESQGVPHFYIDRVVLAEQARGRGFGRELYREVFRQAAKRGYQRVTCEVNLEPPNPVSLAFHEAMGFVPVGIQQTKGGAVTVQLLQAPVSPGAERD